MTRRNDDIEKIVEAHLDRLGMFDSPPVEDVTRSRHRALERLHARAATMTRPATVRSGRSDWEWRPAAIVAAAMILIATLGAAILWRSSDDALFRVADGEVREGRTIRADGSRGAVLTLTDGSRVEMRSQSELALERADDGLRIRLMRGGIIVDAATQRTGHLYVQTKDVTVSVVGTVFLVNADEDGSRVAVIEGEVRVQRGATEQKLRPGEQMATSRAMPPSSIKEEIAWARNAPLLVGLLQQAGVAPEVLAPQNAAPPKLEFEAVSIRPAVQAAGGAGRGAGGGGGRGRRNMRLATDPCSQAGEPVLDPRRFDAANVTLIQLASWAYGHDCWMNRGPDLLLGGPDWIRRDGYDVVATIPEGSPAYSDRQLRLHDAPTLQRMLQAMLTERFQFAIRREMREMSVYVLSVAKGGARLTRANGPARMVDREGKPVVNPQPGSRGSILPPADWVSPEFSAWQESDPRDLTRLGPSEIHGRKRTMADLVSSLWLFTGRPVVDRTGLTGYFNYFLQFAVVECPTCPFTAPGPDTRREPGAGPPSDRSLFSVLEQVGLELKPSREQVEVMVIERVDRPTEN